MQNQKMTKSKRFNTWNEIEWSYVNHSVRKIQYRIYEESRIGNTKQLYKLQKWLSENPLAKFLAVLQVTQKECTSKHVHGKTSITPKEKYELAISLNLDGKSQLIPKVWIDKPGKKEKHALRIPRIQDRAKQALAKIVLEPEWEARFEKGSYGFRPGRSAHDAIAKAFTALSKQVPKWIYHADIRKCFDNINHDALLTKVNTFPKMKKQIESWLKAGIMEEYANIKKEEFTIPENASAQEKVISPLLVNIALHGLENYLQESAAKIKVQPYLGGANEFAVKKRCLSVVRYADDFIVIHQNKEILLQLIPQIESWLSLMGLRINQEKSVLRDGKQGFSFLGFRFVQTKCVNGLYKIKIYPSKENQVSIMKKVRQVIQTGKALSSYRLIQKLRPIIIGWGNYFCISECQTVFRKLSLSIFSKLRKWVFRRDRKHGKVIVKQKYFPSGKCYVYDGREYNDNWILVGKEKQKNGVIRENFLPQMSWFKSRRHVLVKNDSSIFDKKLSLYWSERNAKYSCFSKTTTKVLAFQKAI